MESKLKRGFHGGLRAPSPNPPSPGCHLHLFPTEQWRRCAENKKTNGKGLGIKTWKKTRWKKMIAVGFSRCFFTFFFTLPDCFVVLCPMLQSLTLGRKKINLLEFIIFLCGVFLVWLGVSCLFSCPLIELGCHSGPTCVDANINCHPPACFLSSEWNHFQLVISSVTCLSDGGMCYRECICIWLINCLLNHLQLFVNYINCSEVMMACCIDIDSLCSFESLPEVQVTALQVLGAQSASGVLAIKIIMSRQSTRVSRQPR